MIHIVPFWPYYLNALFFFRNRQERVSEYDAVCIYRPLLTAAARHSDLAESILCIHAWQIRADGQRKFVFSRP